MKCQHIWVAIINFRQWNEQRVCLRCDKRIVIMREK